MRLFSIFAVLFLIIFGAMSLQAQDQVVDRVGVMGVYYSADIPGTVGGFGAVAIPFGQEDKLRSFTAFKVFGATEDDPGNLIVAGHRIRYRMVTGFERQILDFKKFSVHALFAGGFVTDGSDTAGAADMGGFVYIPINKRFGLALIASAEYDGIEQAWVVNPAGGLTIKF
jgi:hypothetical protein